MDIRGVQRSGAAPTRIVHVGRTADGERTFLGFGTRAPDTFADAYFDALELPSDLFDDVRFVVVGSLELAYERSRNAIVRVVNEAHRCGGRVVFDVNRRPMFWTEAEAVFERERALAIFAVADYVKAGDDEARWLFGTDEPRAIAGQGPAHGVLLTRGACSIRYSIERARRRHDRRR